MTSFKTLFFSVLSAAGVAVAAGAPPTQVGDTFISINFQTLPGYVTDQRNDIETFYLATDGSCKRIYSWDEALGFVSYGPTLTGTYTYVPTPGNPNEATLAISFPNIPQYYGYTLEFTSDTQGTITAGVSTIGTESFSMLLPAPNPFLMNVSNRVVLRATDTAITGFVIGGTGNRLVLVRAVGQGLTPFGVAPVSGSPALSLFLGPTLAGSGAPWGSVPGYDVQAMNWIFNLAGAFSLPSGSSDAAFFGVLSPGAYTAQVHDATMGSSGGTALVEIYILPYSG